MPRSAINLCPILAPLIASISLDSSCRSKMAIGLIIGHPIKRSASKIAGGKRELLEYHLHEDWCYSKCASLFFYFLGRKLNRPIHLCIGNTSDELRPSAERVKIPECFKRNKTGRGFADELHRHYLTNTAPRSVPVCIFPANPWTHTHQSSPRSTCGNTAPIQPLVFLYFLVVFLFFPPLCRCIL